MARLKAEREKYIMQGAEQDNTIREKAWDHDIPLVMDGPVAVPIKERMGWASNTGVARVATGTTKMRPQRFCVRSSFGSGSRAEDFAAEKKKEMAREQQEPKGGKKKGQKKYRKRIRAGVDSVPTQTSSEGSDWGLWKLRKVGIA